MVFVLFHSEDVEDLAARLAAVGGRIVARAGRTLVVARITEAAAARVATGPHRLIVSEADLSDEDAEEGRAWLAAVEWSRVPREERPRLTRGIGELEPHPSPGAPGGCPSQWAKAQYMSGYVALGQVFISGPGDLALSSDEVSRAMSWIDQGILVLQELNPTANLVFLTDPRPVVPITNPEHSVNSQGEYEQECLFPALVAMGYSGDDQGAQRFARDVMARMWSPPSGYVVYVSKYDMWDQALAYQYWERVVMDFATDGEDDPATIFAHESSHVFGASDEYADSKCACTDSCGYFQTPGCNCEACTSNPLPCLMRLAPAPAEMCTFTRRQIGWNAWSPQTDITEANKAQSAASPAAASLDSTLYVAYRHSENHDLLMSSFDGVSWSEQMNITEMNRAESAIGPSLAAFNGKLFMAYRGISEEDGNIYVCSFDGTRWSPQTKVTEQNDARTLMTPALAPYQGRLYLVYHGLGGRDQHLLACSSGDGYSWSDQTYISEINGARTWSSPAAAELHYPGQDPRLCVFFQGPEAGTLSETEFHDGGWHEVNDITRLNGAMLDNGPGVARLGDSLWVAYQRYLPWPMPPSPWMTAFSFPAGPGITATEPVDVAPQNHALTSRGPALAAFGAGLQLVYSGEGGRNLWSCHLAPDAPQPDPLQTLWRC